MSKNSNQSDLSDEKTPKSKKNVFGHPVRNLLVTALVSAVIGVAFIVCPSDVLRGAQLIFGILVAAAGIAYILFYFIRKPISGEYRSEFAIGLVLLLAGAYLAVGNRLALGSGIDLRRICLIIGLLIAADGLLKLQYSLDLARMKYKAWWVGLIFSLIGIAIGVVSVIDFSAHAVSEAANDTLPNGFLYGMGGTMGLVSNRGPENGFYSGMMLMGIAYCVNAFADLIVMLLVIIRNHKAAREEALEEAAAKMVAARVESEPVCAPAIPAPVAPAPVAYPAPAPEPPAPAPEPTLPDTTE